ncbi:MAG: hydrogenase maturation protein [Burkholderiales bacterium]
MRILFLAHDFNSLTQRLYVELTALGHDVSIELDANDKLTEEAAALWQPELVVAPFLKRAIPESVWTRHRTIVIHPGIPGDRGPAALDRAILRGETTWGVTALQANAEMDAGDLWAYDTFPMREATKSSLYRNEVTEAAVACMHETLARLRKGASPEPQDYGRPFMRGRPWPGLKQAERAIDWTRDDTRTVLRKIHASDGVPGVRDTMAGLACFLHDAHEEGTLRGAPGEIVATRGTAVCRATRDGAVWIAHLREDRPDAFKLPARMVLGKRLAGVPEAAFAFDARAKGPTWREIRYEEYEGVGILRFAFCNGAMSTAQCEALRAAYAHARSRPVRVIALMGGRDFWSNGIHLNVIEAAPSAADESWRNINAMNDLVRDIVETGDKLTIAAMCGNAGAGGAFLALAADRVIAREAVVLNPHYKGMGNLYGSEYWTYLLPLRASPEHARAVIEARLPIGARAAMAMGLVDECIGGDPASFQQEVVTRAADLAASPDLEPMLSAKRERRARDEAAKPLAAYREEELARMKQNFYGFDSSYHVARYNFVHKVPRSRTPLHLAKHRRRRAS